MDWNKIRSDFPLIANNPDLVYLDSAATSQRPASVLEAEKVFYENYNANPLRGLYDLSQKATECYEDARANVAKFIGAKPEEIVFTRNASESLNLVAFCLSSLLSAGDEVVITVMEHHSNIIPWQQACKHTGATLKFIECDDEGLISEDVFRAAVTDKTKIVSMVHVSNVLGVKNDVKLFAKIAHEVGALFVCDGAQSVPHMAVDVKDLDVDFLILRSQDGRSDGHRRAVRQVRTS